MNKEYFINQLDDIVKEFDTLWSRTKYKDFRDQPIHQVTTLIAKIKSTIVRITGNNSEYYKDIETYLIDNLNTEWFVNNEDREKSTHNEFEFFINSWIDYAKHELKWSKGLTYSVLVRLDNPTDNSRLIESTEQHLQGGIQNKADQGGNCECDSADDWCDGILTPIDIAECKASGCRASSGCGTLWLGDCNGMCVLSVQPIE